ncbi:MAG: hypothetical protein ACR2PO_08220 [Methyloligellaceae bacterium]
MTKIITRFAKCRSGVTPGEFSLVASGMGVTILVLIGELGTELGRLLGIV